MLIPKHYRVQHLLLKLLFEHDEKFPASAGMKERQIHFDDLCEKLHQFDRTYLLDNLDYLRLKEEIYCSLEFDKSKFAIISKGRHAYLEKRYLVEGSKEFRNAFDQKLKIVSTIILLFIAVATFVINIVQTQQNKNQIEQLKSEVRKLQEQKK